MSEFGPLFDLPPPAPSPPKPRDQAGELARCTAAQGPYVLAFLRARLLGKPEGRVFSGKTLSVEVSALCDAAGVQCAPDTPRRVMGHLKDLGHCQVITLKPKSLSLYEVVAVTEE